MNDKNKDNDTVTCSNDNYSLKGLAKFGKYLFASFLVWCTFNYPMSETMQSWFYVWAVAVWFLA